MRDEEACQEILTEPSRVSGKTLQEPGEREGGRASLSLGRESDRTQGGVAAARAGERQNPGGRRSARA